MRKNTEQHVSDVLHRIVIVGGGAGGLELATRLGNTVGKKRKADVLLVDRYATHFWKPLLHEAASGHIDPAQHDISYAAHGKRNSFRFVQGDLEGLDSNERFITVAPLVDEQFRRKLLAACVRADHEKIDSKESNAPLVNVNIIGGGATGVELAASVRDAVEHLAAYRFTSLDPSRDVCVRVIEGNDTLLPGLASELSVAALKHLVRLNVQVMTRARVVEVRKDAFLTAAGETLASDVTLWAAGVAGTPALSNCANLVLNRSGQMLVDRMLRAVGDFRIYAIGDCASINPVLGFGWPVTAQAAHQQAVYLANALIAGLHGKRVGEFSYRDGGTLVSFGSAGAVGRLATAMPPMNVTVRGKAAKILYALIYRRHLVFVTGTLRAAATATSQWLRGILSPPVRLH
jgi:NADH:ubiquinone reductase (H+-translocating)